MKKIKPTIILVRPQLSENIGMAARAMDNFGLSKLSIVNPRDGWPSKKAESSAKHADKIINRAKVYKSLEDAVSNYDLVVATFRSRGVSTQSSGGPVYQVTGGTDVTMVCTGNTFSQVNTDPFATFGIDVTDVDGDSFRFETSMSPTSKDFVKRVFGVAPFDKDMEQVPIFVEEAYPNMLTYAYKKGYIKGLNCSLLDLPSFRNQTKAGTIGFYQEQWQTPVTPYVVSELRGTKVYKLFRFISICDGNAANTQVKISIVNISFERNEFDILVRSFYDTDASPVVLERYTRCSMNPNLNSFVGVKVGTANGEYELKSRYIMVDLDPEQETDTNRHDAVPCGFEGYVTRNYLGEQSPTLYYKTKYNKPGDVIWNPPFAVSSTVDNSVISAGDKIRRVYLGISDTEASAFDPDFFQYKGKQAPTDPCNDLDGTDYNCLTQGFHMDSGATVIKSVVLGISGSKGVFAAATLKPSKGAADPDALEIAGPHSASLAAGGTRDSFTLNLTDTNGAARGTFALSFLTSSANYITRVFSEDAQDTTKKVYVYSNFQATQNLMGGSDKVFVASGSDEAFSFDYAVATTPAIQSQLINSARTDLFKVNTRSHGTNMNSKYRVGISNVKRAVDVPGSDFGTFDVQVIVNNPGQLDDGTILENFSNLSIALIVYKPLFLNALVLFQCLPKHQCRDALLDCKSIYPLH